MHRRAAPSAPSIHSLSAMKPSPPTYSSPPPRLRYKRANPTHAHTTSTAFSDHLKMQRRARHGSSGGELDVFGATRYFDGLADLAAGPVTVSEPQGLVIQVEATRDMKHMEESYRSIQELGLEARCKSNLATFFGSPVSPAGSFRLNPPGSGSTTTTTSGSHDELPQLVSSSSSRHSSGTATSAAAFDSRDLGELVGDRRLQGVRVVRGAGGEEERWVVRCGGGRDLQEERHVDQKIVDAASGDDHRAAEVVEDGDDSGSDSDTSSDLFELDLEHANKSLFVGSNYTAICRC